MNTLSKHIYHVVSLLMIIVLTSLTIFTFIMKYETHPMAFGMLVAWILQYALVSVILYINKN